MDFLALFAYTREKAYFRSVFNCKFTAELLLCQRMSEYRQYTKNWPSLRDFLVYLYEPCEPDCPYPIPIEEWFIVAEHLIVEFGLYPRCLSIQVCYVFLEVENRFPSLREYFDLLENGGEDVTQWMQDDVDDYWAKKKATVDLTRFPVRLAEEEKETCCICQEDINENQPIRTLPCGHFFHSTVRIAGPSSVSEVADCEGIEPWLEKCNSCPLCKYTV